MKPNMRRYLRALRQLKARTRKSWKSEVIRTSGAPVYVDYQAKKDSMTAYLRKTKQLIAQFKQVTLLQIPREQNFRADILARLTSLANTLLPSSVLIEILPRSTIDNDYQEVQCVIDVSCWMDPIIKYLTSGDIPEDKEIVRRLQYHTARYCLIDGVLYRHSYSLP